MVYAIYVSINVNTTYAYKFAKGVLALLSGRFENAKPKGLKRNETKYQT